MVILNTGLCAVKLFNISTAVPYGSKSIVTCICICNVFTANEKLYNKKWKYLIMKTIQYIVMEIIM